jgi:hypothetical protein
MASITVGMISSTAAAQVCGLGGAGRAAVEAAERKVNYFVELSFCERITHTQPFRFVRALVWCVGARAWAAR